MLYFYALNILISIKLQNNNTLNNFLSNTKKTRLVNTKRHIDFIKASLLGEVRNPKTNFFQINFLANLIHT